MLILASRLDFLWRCILLSALLQRSLHKSVEEEAKNAALREKGLLEDVKSLKSQLAAKEKEKVETVEALHNIESRCISVGAKLETKTEDFDNLKKDFDKIVKEKITLRRNLLRKIKIFMTSVIVYGNFCHT